MAKSSLRSSDLILQFFDLCRLKGMEQKFASGCLMKYLREKRMLKGHWCTGIPSRLILWLSSLRGLFMNCETYLNFFWEDKYSREKNVAKKVICALDIVKSIQLKFIEFRKMMHGVTIFYADSALQKIWQNNVKMKGSWVSLVCWYGCGSWHADNFVGIRITMWNHGSSMHFFSRFQTFIISLYLYILMKYLHFCSFCSCYIVKMLYLTGSLVVTRIFLKIHLS